MWLAYLHFFSDLVLRVVVGFSDESQVADSKSENECTNAFVLKILVLCCVCLHDGFCGCVCDCETDLDPL